MGVHPQLPILGACGQELHPVVFIFLLLSILASQDRVRAKWHRELISIFVSEEKAMICFPKAQQLARTPAHAGELTPWPWGMPESKGYEVFSLHKRQYLRRDNFFPAHKFCVGDCLAMPFEHHDRLLSVAKIVVVNTVIWRWERKGKT